MFVHAWIDRCAVVVLAVVCGFGCGPKVGEPGSDTEPMSDAGGDAGDDDGGDGDEAEDDGGVIVGGSCAGLDPEGPTVGGGDIGPSGFPPACNPRVDGGPVGAYTCCSDDPAAEGGALPAYQGKDVPDGATPYFSGANNIVGTSGACVKTADIPAESALAEATAAGCPIPCDPLWSDDSIAAVCGPAHVCCQTQELQEADCIIDPTSGKWRPVDGTDIGTMYEDGVVVTDWAPSTHATHQDPGGSGCMELAGGDINSPLFFDCVTNLHVAHHRGFCMALAPGQLCPLTATVDACEALNES